MGLPDNHEPPITPSRSLMERSGSGDGKAFSRENCDAVFEALFER